MSEARREAAPEALADLDRLLAADLTQFPAVKAVRSWLERERAATLEAIGPGSNGVALCHRLSRLTETVVVGMFDRLRVQCADAGRDGLTLAALGGFGREELAPGSDVDLAILHRGALDGAREGLISAYVKALWDLGLEVGISTRDPAATARKMDEDVTTATALLDARFLAGDQGLFERVRADVVRPWLARHWRRFVEAKIDESVRRHRFYGDSVFLKEPNVKENRGGLRDWQTARWIDLAFRASRGGRDAGPAGLDTAAPGRAAFSFLLLARAAMHRASGRKVDVLDMHLQHDVAALLGYTDDGGHLGVERFMREYYRAGRAVDWHFRAVQGLYEGRVGSVTRRLREFTMKVIPALFAGRDERLLLSASVPDARLDDPAAVMDLLLAAQEHDLDLEQDLLLRLRRHVERRREEFARSDACGRKFLEILARERGSGRAVALAQAAGVLGALIPEWQELECLVEYNAWHQYTVDEHTFRAISAIDRTQEEAAAGADSLRHRVARGLGARGRLLKLALLLHDIGKARGVDHVQAGRTMAPLILQRLGLPEEEMHAVYFLIEHHLLMSDVAQKRDIHEPHVVREFCSRVVSVSRLEMLLLMTLADMEAVGHGTLTGWKEAILSELFLKAQTVLSGRARTATRVERSLEADLLALVDGAVREPAERASLAEQVRRHCAAAPSRYRLEVSAEEALDHVRLLGRPAADPAEPMASVRPGADATDIWIACANAPGRFAQLAGVLSSLHANIVEARAYSFVGGAVLDHFAVTFAGETTDPGRAQPPGEEFADALRARLRAVLRGETPVADLIARARRSRPPARVYPFTAKPLVAVANHLSPALTVIEIIARDRLGLLYELASCLSACGLDIELSMVTTQGNVAYDTFYVTLSGEKAPAGRVQNDIEQRLWAVVR
ncbi:MAG: [protein-PII] uridylyltransferase [Planctomycetes bacterium]|nr:[protein-PII] uridylyltransferase [Planctomycetota bacterium]